jgi:hypothetical protein
MIKDFVTYNNDRIHELVFELPGDDNISSMTRDAQLLDSFVRIDIRELGPGWKQRGIWFRVTVIFNNVQDATWYRLKWT